MNDRGRLMEQVSRVVEYGVRPLRNKLNSMIARGSILAADDSKLLQSLKVKWFGDPSEFVEHLQPGGFTHVPLAGADVVILRTTQGIQICVGGTDRKVRPKGHKPGESMMYGTGDALGSTIYIKQDGTIEITPVGGVTTIKGELKVTGDVKVDGEVTGMASTPGATVTLTQHKHFDAMGSTQVPTPGT